MRFNNLTALLSIAVLSGCIATTFPYMRAETAQRIAAPAWMIKRDIPADQFTLRAYERIHDRGGIANLYIEGDGSEYTSPSEWSNNPTPKNPIALHLASKDNAQNVIYLARPCQYTAMSSSTGQCDEKYWKGSRYSNDVLDSYNAALDEISQRYNITSFHLIGYSGGAAIASLIAAHRKDILSLRTVSGIMDHETHRTIHGLPALSDSENPLSEALSLIKLPQYHFIGGQDKIVPPSIIHSYLQSTPPTNCIQTMLIQESEYENGWVEKWPELLQLPVRCYGASAAPELQDYQQTKTPLFNSYEKPAKP